MFTGLVEELGQVRNISKRANITLFEISAQNILKDTEIGDSISVNGACLTVVKKERGNLFFEAIPQTLKDTNLGSLKVLERVNLEQSLKLGGKLSGHFVTGHIDCIGIIRKKNYFNNNLCFEIAVPKEFIRYCLPKGSIAVDGISLTLANKTASTFFVNIIPHTLKNTTLGFKGYSDKVNVEFDILAKKTSSPAINHCQGF